VSATPLIRVDAEDIDARRKGFVGVPFEEVVQSGLIKQETTINQQIGKFLDVAQSADAIVVEAALAKREELRDSYRSLGIQVNPLVLIQLPTESKETSALDLSVREAIEEQLDKRGITYSNGKLAVWLSGEQQNKELIEKNTSEVEVLIFKEAIAVGWDCPRAQILVMLRAIKSITFEIQTVGRILRMPEARHYEREELNKAYVYTNIASINITTKPEELDFFKSKFSILKPGVGNVNLPSIKVHRQDYGDLTASFVAILVDQLNKRFGINDLDTVNSAFEKADRYLELSPSELERPLISDLMVKNLDQIQSELGELPFETLSVGVSTANIQREFDYLLKVWCLPYAPVRSFSKLKTGLYKWFGLIGFDSSRWDEVQRIVACSENNQKLFTESFEAAKSSYAKTKAEELSQRKGLTESIFSLPHSDLFGETYEVHPGSKYSHEPCFLRTDRSQPERLFEQSLESSDQVEWWYKNGESQQRYFSIAYQSVDEEKGIEKTATFYPDYVVKFKNSAIGIYDTKSGHTITERSTHDKSDALQAYIRKNSELGLQGGIVRINSEGMFVFSGAVYDPNQDSWSRLEL
jgi:type III restriction enzyme